MSNEHYLNNPLIHRDRRLGRRHSEWVNQFDCTHLRPLIICRGPDPQGGHGRVRRNGHRPEFGILLSEKDSIVYRNALAPELRSLTDPDRVHRVPDYTGANKEERDQRIQQIIAIAQGQRLQLRVCRLRLHGGRRDHGRRVGSRGPEFHRPLFDGARRRRSRTRPSAPR